MEKQGKIERERERRGERGERREEREEEKEMEGESMVRFHYICVLFDTIYFILILFYICWWQ
jgi:hypothetical protein